MGEASDAVKGQAGRVGSDALESAKNAASKVADRAQTALKEEGFSPAAIAEAAGEKSRRGHPAGRHEAADDPGLALRRVLAGSTRS